MVGIPIKPFSIAKARLATILSARQRAVLGMAIAAHTARAVAASGATPAIATGSDDVRTWAGRHGWRVIDEIPGRGLDGAAAATVAAAGGRSWAVVHADLPVVVPEDFAAAWDRFTGDGVIAPSHDGGTALLAGTGPFRFAYGPASFHRHLREMPAAAVVATPGLALDLDTAQDLLLATQLPAGEWLRGILDPAVRLA